MRAPVGDRVILILTFVLTVLIDLTVAIGVGVVLAALMFMHRMAEVSAIRNRVSLDEEEEAADDAKLSDTAEQRQHLPKGVEVYELRGPLFFGVAEHLLDLLQRTGQAAKIYILNLRDVPLVDATGASTLRDFIDRCKRRNIPVYIAGLSKAVKATLRDMHALPRENATLFKSLEAALEKAAADPGKH